MFASFLNMLYPAKKFLTSVLKILNYNPSSYDIGDLEKQMNQKEQCDLLNGTIDVSEINKKLPLKKFFLQNILIKRTNFIFKRNYAAEKTKLFFEDIIIDIFQKKEKEDENIDNNKINEENKEEKKDAGGFLNSVINVVVHNLEVGFKNIIIKFYDKENKSIEYTLFIKNIEFKEAKDVKPIQSIDKGKYLFIHNKAVYIESILFKEKFEEENDQLFFDKITDNDWSKNYLKNNNCVLYIKYGIELDIFHDKDNSILTLSNINTSKFYLENILNQEQLSKIYNYFKQDKTKEIKEKKVNIKKNEKDMDIMGFKIKKINFELKIDLLYFILFEKNQKENIKEKKWISQDEIQNGENIMDKIIDNFNSYKTKYYIFCINNFMLKLKDKIANIDNISLNLINMDNIVNGDKNIFEKKNIVQITKFNFDYEKKELLYDNIYFEINKTIIGLVKLILNNNNDNNPKDNNQVVNNDINNVNIKQEEKKEEKKVENNIISTKEEIDLKNNIIEEKKPFKIKGNNFNIKIFIDKNLGETIDKISLYDAFNAKNDLDYANFIISNIIIDENNNNKISYDKFELTYNDIENKSIYHIINISDKLKESKITYGQNNETFIELNLELYVFINPKIIKPLLTYYKTISKLIPKKDHIQNNNPEEINNLDNKNISSDSILNININAIKIILTENQNLNEEEEEIFNIKEDKNELPQNEIKVIDEKSNNICINLNKIKFRMEKNKDLFNYNFSINSLLIQDNIYNSKYKIMFSNYYFKKENEIFLNCDINIVFNNELKKYEIKPKITIAPLAIYLDQISLYYILNIFRQIKTKEENEAINNINNDNNQENNSYIISNIEIQSFFIEINYNTNNQALKEYKAVADEMTSLLNTTSINKLNIIFEVYKLEENKYLPIKQALKNIYEYYSDNIIKQVSGSLVSALPLFHHIYNSIDGMVDIVRKPLDNYNKNESVIEGLVQGVGSWVEKTATMFTYLGESIGSVFNFKGCSGNKDENLLNKEENSTFREFRYLFNQNNKDIEEYYLKW